MKKFSLEAKELLSKAEMYEIKAGKGERIAEMNSQEACGLLCHTCIVCETCKSCSSKVMDVIVIP